MKAALKYLLVALLWLPSISAATDAGPETVVSGLWQALSREPGERPDIPRLKAIFHEQAIVAGSTYKEGMPAFRVMAAADFLSRIDRTSAQGFHECEIAREIKIHDRFATVYSVVESRTEPGAVEPDFTGVNSIQLYRNGDAWQIISLYYHVPEAALPQSDMSGKPGVCLT